MSTADHPDPDLSQLSLLELDKCIAHVAAELEVHSVSPPDGLSSEESRAWRDAHDASWLRLIHEQHLLYEARQQHVERARETIAQRNLDEAWWEQVRIYDPTLDVPGMAWAVRFSGTEAALTPIVPSEQEKAFRVLMSEDTQPRVFQISPRTVGWGQLDRVLQQIRWLWSENPEGYDSGRDGGSDDGERFWGTMQFAHSGDHYAFMFAERTFVLPDPAHAEQIARHTQGVLEALDS